MVETFQKQRDTMKSSEVAKEEAKAPRPESPKVAEERKLEAEEKTEVEKKAEEKKKAEEEEKTGEEKEVKPAEKPAEKPREAKEAKKAKEEKPHEIVEEKLLVVPFRKAFRKVQPRRAAYAARLLKEFVARHTKTSAENISIDLGLNNILSAERNPPKKLRVKTARDKEGKVTVQAA